MLRRAANDQRRGLDAANLVRKVGRAEGIKAAQQRLDRHRGHGVNLMVQHRCRNGLLNHQSQDLRRPFARSTQRPEKRRIRIRERNARGRH